VKKFLLLLLGIMLLFSICIAVIGASNRTFDYENSVTIAKPPAEVWAAITDDTRMKEWLQGFVRMENVQGDPLTVGSKWKLVFLEGDEEIEVFETVTEVKIGETFAFDMETDPFLGHTTIQLTPAGDGTTLTATNTVKGKGLLMSAALRIMKGMMESRAQSSYGKLREMVEAG